MIKFCEGDHEKQLIDVAPSRSTTLEMPIMSELRRTEPMSVTGSSAATVPNQASASSRPNTPQNQPTGQNTRQQPHIHIAAIDNSLSFPWEHPKGWRSYTYGWLYLPVSIIGRPFSQKTRDHFLPLLTSKEWWEETTYELRKLFSVDPDFNLMMFNVSG
jgi:phosphatidylinositol 4-kinase type 2